MNIINPTPSKNGDEILRITSEDKQLIGKISEKQLNYFKYKQEVKLIDKNNHIYYGTIQSIGEIPITSNSKTSLYQIIIKASQTFPIGSHFKVQPNHENYEVPKSSLIEKEYVFILKNGNLVKRKIKYTTSKNAGYMIVTQGLNIRDKVVKNPKNLEK